MGEHPSCLLVGRLVPWGWYINWSAADGGQCLLESHWKTVAMRIVVA